MFIKLTKQPTIKNIRYFIISIKENIISSITGSQLDAGAFIFAQDESDFLTLTMPTYDIKILFKERLAYFNDVPKITYDARVKVCSEDVQDISFRFYLSKDGNVSTSSIMSSERHHYNDDELLLNILIFILAELRSKHIISY